MSALGSTGSDAQLRRRTNVVTETSDAPPPFDEEDLKLAKRREERAASRATQRSLQSAGVAAGSSREAADPQFRKSQYEADIQGLGPPPPFDEEDLKLAKRREEKAAARAALKQSSLSAMSTLGDMGSDVWMRRRSNVVTENSDAPPPFDEEDLKLVKRREERAAARATQRSLQSAGVAAGSSREAADPLFRKSQNEADIQGLGPPPPFDEEDLKLAKRLEEKAAARAALKQSSLSATSPHGIDWFA
jgi:hypothetical protein